MSEPDDHQLLAEFARENSEAAFAALVQRHINLVYSAALRRVGNLHAAEEITQAVFLILARKAGRLSPRIALSGWLYQTARLTAANFLRGEIRRQKREQEAYMQSKLNCGGDASSPTALETIWPQIAPLLDDALGQLGERDRNALVLRFFENKSLAEVGATLDASEDAAKMRVNRALEKLRKIFTKRGVTLSAALIAGAVSASSVQAAPAGLAATISTVAIAKGAAAGGSTLALVKGVLKIMAWTKAKTAIVVGASVLLAAGATTITVREVQEHRTYPWQIKEGEIVQFQLNQPPQVRILPSKFQKRAEYIGATMVGTGLRAQDVVAAAYGSYSSARAVFQTELPARRYDYIACLPGGETANKSALQEAVKRKFGVVGKPETRNANAWLLKVKFPNAPGLQINTSGKNGNGFWPVSSELFRGWNEPILGVAIGLENEANIPVIDETGLTNRFDFDLNCSQTALANTNWDSINGALDKLGLELVPTNMPIKMLVVEKAK
jgi:uncharacterized protein (TIGR03435 family)